MFNITDLEHFGIENNPFESGRVPRNAYFENNEIEKSTKIVLKYAREDGFLLVTAPTGMGKSNFLLHLLPKLKSERKLNLVMPNPLQPDKIDSGYLLSELIQKIGKQKCPNEIRDRQNVCKMILHKAHKEKRKICMIIDEAHRLPEQTFSTLKMFWEGLGVHFGKMSIILIAQPIIEQTLTKITLKEVSSRITTLHFSMFKGNDQRPQIKEYISHRLKIAGAESNFFTDCAVEAISKRAVTPQDINNICLRAMSEAADVGITVIDKHLIDEV
ncbi:MAG: AAA family ATPase [bacterium]|nr:AAA family ATPase [bacterium]